MSEELKARKELLLSGEKNGYEKLTDLDEGAMEAYCDAYKAYLDNGKTERLCAT